MAENMNYYHLGDTALVVDFGGTITLEINSRIRQLTAGLAERKIPGMLEAVPGYTTLTLHYNPLTISYDRLVDLTNEILKENFTLEIEYLEPKVIPVWYNGPDLAVVSKHTGLRIEEIIERHTDVEYLVYMIGFAPGFPYLGGMDKILSTPRRETPRIKIPAGSVGIAGEQTGVYPMETPGGWQLIGQTPIVLFDIEREQPSFLSAGDRVKFHAITQEKFENYNMEKDGN
ncbi:5-oxoprolinase subunit PxpB [Sphingobacterium hotanense]|nr:5-oxoprolinase subunit PxpB [Sphingobacterium hotanense]